MANKQTEIDTGHMIVFIEHSEAQRVPRIFFTCYVNNMSVRSCSLHLTRIRDAYIEAVIAACCFPEGPEAEEQERILEARLQEYIATHVCQ
jgi:hypothetical protein